MTIVRKGYEYTVKDVGKVGYFFMKIKSLLITVLACFVIIPSVAFACIADVEMNKLAMKNYKQTAQSMVENQTYNISEYFRIISASAKQIADNPDILSFDKEKILQLQTLCLFIQI